ncbi:MAG: hypothetical protein M1818_004056 [Claussenomyces sp. TS43310]|nr:MAG: hypothetical protein M1818_004056 [Claussenomyces sp. TS43310]
MSNRKQPKVLLFDIGGVCVVSPFQAILEYEITHGIPPGWINYSISKSSPNGAWHQLERGELAMDAAYFAAFNHDLRDARVWKDFYAQFIKKQNPTVGAYTTPPVPDVDGEWLFFEMMRIARTPDPWMWPALQKLKASRRYLLAALSNTVIFPSDHPYSQFVEADVRNIFNVFVSSAHVGLRKPDPKIYDLALNELNAYAKEHADGWGRGLGWEEGIRPEDVVFLDDIGSNLKAASKAGFSTVKVFLGQAYDAVTELEKITGLKLAGDHPRISSAPKISKVKL